MSGPSLSDGAYSRLNTYALLSGGASTAAATTTITNGKYGSSPTATTDVNFAGTQDNTGNADTSQSQRTALVNAINSYASGLSPAVTLGTETTITLYPGRNYNSGSDITFNGAITLDAGGDPNALFFIRAVTGITFGSTPTITLINGARNSNIFWLAGSSITFTGTSPSTGVPGIFIAGASITFASAVNVSGRLYAGTGIVTFIGVSSVNGYLTTLADICFPANTPIVTDQGEVEIALVNPEFHTIRGNKIVAVTKVIGTSNFLVCFEKDCLGENLPSQTTIMSKYHKVEYNGKMYKAYHFIGHIANVHEVEYSGEPLYNILMDDHSTMTVNGLTCETLHPDNQIARLYTGRYEIPTKTGSVLPNISVSRLIRGY